MAGVNNFKVFAGAPGADVISQSAYEALLALTNGFSTGTAISGQLNKVWRQSSIMSAVLAQFVAEHSSHDVLDDGTIATILTDLELAISAVASAGLTGVAYLDLAQAWTAGQRGSVVSLTDGASITPDFAAGNNFTVTLAGNRVLSNPTNVLPGQSGVFVVSQDGVGTRQLSFGSSYKFQGGVTAAPILTTTANAVDHLYYYAETSSRILISAAKDVK